MPYTAPLLGTATIELQAPGSPFDPVTLLEFGADGYQTSVVNQIKGEGRTAGNVTKIEGLPVEYSYRTWALTVRVDPTRAAIIQSMIRWQQRQLSAKVDNPIVLIDRFVPVPFDTIHEGYTLVPDSIETEFGMTRGFAAYNVILNLADDNPIAWVAKPMIDLKLTAVQLV